MGYTSHYFPSFCPTFPYFHLIGSYCAWPSFTFWDSFNKHIWVIYLALFFRLFAYLSLFLLNKFILYLPFVRFSHFFLINTYGWYTSHYFSVFLSPTFPYFNLITSYCACLSCAFRDIYNKHIWVIYLALFFRLFVSYLPLFFT
jgi:hypothetical protein